jgi:23S rRNA (adenine2030-N6)-methyltransferase
VNYRHAFHAGNFADLVKHAALTLVIARLTAGGGPLLVVDSHAGAGLYDLHADLARKSGEADAGVARLMADDSAPQAFAALKTAVRGANVGGGLRFYPGSPLLIADQLRPQDEYLGAEMRADDAEALSLTLGAWGRRARAVKADGYDLIKAQASDRRRLFVLVDPPFEQPDDYERIADAVATLLTRPDPTTALIWLPLKDLETYDGFLRRLEAMAPTFALTLETRLVPLTDPMRMNGCALVLIDPPKGLEPALLSASQWAVAKIGGMGGVAKLWRLNG